MKKLTHIYLSKGPDGWYTPKHYWDGELKKFVEQRVLEGEELAEAVRTMHQPRPS